MRVILFNQERMEDIRRVLRVLTPIQREWRPIQREWIERMYGIAAELCAQLPETTAINEFLCTDEYL